MAVGVQVERGKIRRFLRPPPPPSAGQLQLLDSGFLQDTLQLISNGKTFTRVDEPLSWPDALRICRLYMTDLADLESSSSLFSLVKLYQTTDSPAAWIGLFFDVATQQLAWSSGSIFSGLQWGQLPHFEAGICATLSSTMGMPTLGADACTARKPFICYYGASSDEKVGHRLTTGPPPILTTYPPPALPPLHTYLPVSRFQAPKDPSLLQLAVCQLAPLFLPRPVTVQVGGRTFLRFEQSLPWLEALVFCRGHCTDLADLPVLDKAGLDALAPITWELPQAWVGLYFSAASNAPSWSSDPGDGDARSSLLEVPMMGAGLCGGLGNFRGFGLRLYVTSCSMRRPFICFYVPLATEHNAKGMQFLSGPDSVSCVGGTSGPALGNPAVAAETPAPALDKTITVSEPLGGAQIPWEAFEPPWLPASTPPAPPVGSTGLQEEAAGTPPAPTASPGVTEPRPKDPGTPDKSVTRWTATQAATVLPSRSPGPPETPQSSSARPEGATQSPTEDPRLRKALTRTAGDADGRHTAPASGVQEHSTLESPPEPERRFGILRADFALPAGVDPEGHREQLLQEIRCALQLTLGPEALRLKWVALEHGQR
ncbi:putative C-type lectin domain family 20 member A [Sorex araneus]|uniref:putative C-type lectin domain family 20 member A n=1 Tax=Sorex araneus TaxID=42254 RepID=UPI002433F0A1|nr:putative C-type lectin domain family 20 member A [Sorex araneus]